MTCDLYWYIFPVACLGWFRLGMMYGRNKRDKQLYSEYKKRTDAGAEPLAIDILINRITNRW